MENLLSIHEEVAAAVKAGRPVVALESALIAHGLPRPHNLETAHKMEAAVRAEAAVPATLGVLEGKMIVGLAPAQVAFFANSDQVAKVSRADLAPALASGGAGATTVAATMYIAARAGIRVVATGGIGGVHRGAETSFDVSADLMELARTPLAVVCSGAKAVLDLPRTLEILETLGVPVVGYGTHEFPAFFSRESGLCLPHRADSPEEVARLMSIQWQLGAFDGAHISGMVIANPPPAESALPRAEVESHITEALKTAELSGIRGKAVTPYLLQEVARRSAGKTLRANIALLVANARLAAQIAVAWSARRLQR